METNKKHSLAKRLTSVFLSFALLFTSFNYAFNARNLRLPVAGHTGEEYFNAIYFKKGDLANQIYKDELAELVKENDTNYNKEEIAEVQALILSTIKKQNPGYMDQFKRGIESSDLNTIEATVLKGGELIYKTVETLDKGALANNEIYQKFMSDYASAGSGDKQNLLLYLVAVFAIAVYAAVYLWKVGPRATELTTMDDQTRLYREQFVYNIYKL